MSIANAQELRDSRASFHQYVSQRSYDFVTAALYPIHTWGAYTYIVVGRLDLTPERQFLEVIDITTDPDVARFSNRWPDREPRDHALLLTPELGQSSVLQEDGGSHGIHYAELPVRLISATRAEMIALREKQMEELKASVIASPASAEDCLREFVLSYANVGRRTNDGVEIALFRVWLQATQILGLTALQSKIPPREEEGS